MKALTKSVVLSTINGQKGIEAMKVKDYFKRLGECDSVTFIKARARKDAHTPYYHAEYQTTPTRTVEEWSDSSLLMDYIVLNHEQPPIEWLSGTSVKWWKCILIISEEDLATLYPNEHQRQSMISYIDSKIK